MAVDPLLLADAIEVFLNEPDDHEIAWCEKHFAEHTVIEAGGNRICWKMARLSNPPASACRIVEASVLVHDVDAETPT